MKNKLKKTDLSITVILLIGIVVVLNFFSYQLFLRLDLTQDRVFSISKASKNTVAKLDDIINIKAYFSDNLPNQVLSLRQEVADILDEYAAYSNGKIKIEFIDPNDNEDLQRELYMLGIPQLTFEVYEKDKRQLVNGYMGLAISYGDKTEVIAAVKQNTSGLEYQLTTAIKKVVTEEIATIGILEGKGTKDMQTEMQTAYEELLGLYSVEIVSLDDEAAEINPDIDTLLIIGATESFSENELEAINDFVVRGGALMVLNDGITIGQGLQANINQNNIGDLLSKYGINLDKNLVADTQSGMASFSQGFFTFSTPYAFWPKISEGGFNAENSAVSNLESVIFPWVSSISVDGSKINEADYSYLAHSSDKSWALSDNFNIAPSAGGISPQGEQKIRDLAVLVNGQLDNPYAEEGAEKFLGKIIVVGDSEFATDSFIQNTPDNLNFFQNLVDILSFDEDLIKIRSKGASLRPIEKELSDSAKIAIRYLNVFGVTIIVMAFGMIRYFMRRRSRFVDDL
jgi:gliding-associated putative ABC transporter substrate-binding component GldG